MSSLDTILAIASSGMLSQQFNMDVIANNIANINTPGFHRSRVEFADVIYDRSALPTAGESAFPVAGVRVAATRRLSTPGIVGSDHNALDLSIDGDGFFQVRMPDGTTAYTRDGTLSLDADGRLVNSAGLVLLPEVRIDPSAESIDVTADGRVLVGQNGEITEVGQIALARFVEPAALEALGFNAFRETAASGPPITGAPGSQGLGGIVQRTTELSNVDLADEMLNMITAQRAYQLSSRAAQVADEMMRVANEIRG